MEKIMYEDDVAETSPLLLNFEENLPPTIIAEQILNYAHAERHVVIKNLETDVSTGTSQSEIEDPGDKTQAETFETEESKEKTLVILTVVGSNIHKQRPIESYYQRAMQALGGTGLNIKFLISVNEGDIEAANFISEFANTHENVEALIISDKGHPIDSGGGAQRYIYGWLEAAKRGDFVLEVDGGGAHAPDEMAKVVQPLIDGKIAALSTRFSHGGSNLYPAQRKISSMAITVLSNMLLDLGMIIPDMASGFEGFQSSFLNELFKNRPAEEWITFRSATLLIQTEIRAYLMWWLKANEMDPKEWVEIVGISYGKEKKGGNISKDIGTRALKGFWELMRYKNSFIKEVKSNKN